MIHDIITTSGERLDGEVVTLTAMRAIQRQCFDTSAHHGFHDSDAQNLESVEAPTLALAAVDHVTVSRDYLSMLQDTRRLMLIVSEAAEAMEHQRDANPLTFWLCKKCGAMLDEPREHRDETTAGPETRRCEAGPQDLKPDGFGYELADIVIRAFDQAERVELDLPQLVADKMKFNQGRPHKHGRTF